MTHTILIVDDLEQNRELLEEQLDDSEYKTVMADDGDTALIILRQDPLRFSAVLLDWMMPRMDGITVLQTMKKDPLLRQVPVILQTAKAMESDIHQGFFAGARNYLAKPFNATKLRAVLWATIQDFEQQQAVIKKLNVHQATMQNMASGKFYFQTIEQAQDLATMISATSPQDPQTLLMGLVELLYNAIEHGNLGITYKEKSILLEQGEFQQEIKKRLHNPRYKKRRASLTFTRKKDKFHFFIQDEGAGFNWHQYLEINPARVFHLHGRGIAMCNKTVFQRLEYQGRGNEVLAVYPFYSPPSTE
ncbi:MAG: response regulator [Magnetococcales bacterium]|nr:response regulator [Magnetococcales bacterium]